MHADGDDDEGEDAEEDDGVDEDGDGAGGHVAELHHPGPRRQLEQQPRASLANTCSMHNCVRRRLWTHAQKHTT